MGQDVSSDNSEIGQPDAETESAKYAHKKKGKQAVVIIHGIGEQIPMDTLRGFVRAVWVTDEDLIDEDRPDGQTGEKKRKRNPIWTRPDKRNRNFELRRITTEEDRNDTRTDFYEFYWAHLMHGTTLSQVLGWIWELFSRPRNKVPANVMPMYNLVRRGVMGLALAFIVIAVVVGTFFAGVYAAIAAFISLGAVSFVLGSLGSFFKSKIQGTLTNVAGDVVRYVKAEPSNVARRQEIRENGVRLLETLMGITPEKIAEFDAWKDAGADPSEQPKWDTQYDRIIVVGHSLGSIVGYDLLKYIFARAYRLGFGGYPEQSARAALEQQCREAMAAGDLSEEDAEEWTDNFRLGQRKAFAEMRAQGSPWIVSDFVTVGAALTHAEFLLAEDDDDLERQQAERILPTCPPVLEWDRHTDMGHFSFRTAGHPASPTDKEAGAFKSKNPDHFRYPHHAAHFAFTRWTNLYSPSNGHLKGDIVSGPVAEHFASRPYSRTKDDHSRALGVKDVSVLEHKDKHESPPNKFTHLDYWSLDEMERVPKLKVPEHIRELRDAIDLLFNDEEVRALARELSKSRKTDLAEESDTAD